MGNELALVLVVSPGPRKEGRGVGGRPAPAGAAVARQGVPLEARVEGGGGSPSCSECMGAIFRTHLLFTSASNPLPGIFFVAE